MKISCREFTFLFQYHYQSELVFTMCVSNLLFAYATGASRSSNDRTPFYVYMLCSVAYVGAMLCSNYALGLFYFRRLKILPLVLIAIFCAGSENCLVVAAFLVANH